MILRTFPKRRASCGAPGAGAARVAHVWLASCVAVLMLAWQLLRRESARPALFGFAGVLVCAALAFITGQAKDFYLPGIWMYLGMAIAFTVSVTSFS